MNIPAHIAATGNDSSECYTYEWNRTFANHLRGKFIAEENHREVRFASRDRANLHRIKHFSPFSDSHEVRSTHKRC